MVRADLEKLKLLIEKIEMIPNDQLGIILSQNNKCHYGLHLYSDSRDSVGIEDLKTLIRLFRSFSDLNFYTENEKECAGTAATKRILLDFLNSNYLLLKGSNDIKWLMMDLDYIYTKKEWKPTELDRLYSFKEEKIEDRHVDKVVKLSLLRLLSFKEYQEYVKVNKGISAKTELIANIIYNETNKEYDFALFSDFKKHFKSMGSIDSKK